MSKRDSVGNLKPRASSSGSKPDCSSLSPDNKVQSSSLSPDDKVQSSSLSPDHRYSAGNSSSPSAGADEPASSPNDLCVINNNCQTPVRPPPQQTTQSCLPPTPVFLEVPISPDEKAKTCPRPQRSAKIYTRKRLTGNLTKG